MTPLIPLDSLGSVRTRCGSFEAICWTHRGGGWDVHAVARDAGPDLQGAAVHTKREAYALVRKLHREYWNRERARENNDSSCWT